MAARKRKTSKKQLQRKAKSGGHNDGASQSWRAMEGMMRQLSREMTEAGLDELADQDAAVPFRLDPSPSNPANEAALRIVDQAILEEAPARQVAAAREALRVSPDCADAYLLLADHADGDQEALELYECAVAAAERALGERAFVRYEGHFWSAVETRPYMRARMALANALWSAERFEEATQHYDAMLRLNPNDNQGIRYLLVHALLDQERHGELHAVLDEYDDDRSAEWSYTRALLAFREEGDTQQSRRLLKAAEKVNKHVPGFLTGMDTLPHEMPEFFSPGDSNEAVSYTAQFLPCWKNTPGATSWLRATLNVPVTSPTSSSARDTERYPNWRQLQPVLAGLQQAPDQIWEVDVRSVPVSTEPDGRTTKRWLVVIVNITDERVQFVELAQRRPKTKEMWQYLIESMRAPSTGEPTRPGQIRVRLRTLHSAWQGKLQKVQIDCRQCDVLANVDDLLEYASEGPLPFSFADSAAGSDEPSPPIAELPQISEAIWQADVRRLSAWIDVGGQPQRPWVTLVANATEEEILAAKLDEQPPDAHQFWHSLQTAMAHPSTGPAHRPAVVQLVSGDHSEIIQPQLEAAGVKCVVTEDLELIDSMASDFADHLAGSGRMPPVLNSPGVTLAQLGEFFKAAAEFYRATPWRHIPGDTPIQVECESLQSGPWYAVVMGQSGLELGFALYEDPQLLFDLLSGTSTDEQNSRRTCGMSVTYGEAFDIAPQDLDAAERYGWPVAGPEAYPSVLRINPGLALRAPLVWELELLTACLKQLPKFVKQSVTECRELVPVAGRELPLRLALVEDFN